MNDPKGNTQAEMGALLARLEAHAARLGKNNSNAASTINVNGGTWVSYLALALVFATLCVVALACLFIAFQLSDLRQKDENFQAYINAGYVQPEAKEEPEK